MGGVSKPLSLLTFVFRQISIWNGVVPSLEAVEVALVTSAACSPASGIFGVSVLTQQALHKQYLTVGNFTIILFCQPIQLGCVCR